MAQENNEDIISIENEDNIPISVGKLRTYDFYTQEQKLTNDTILRGKIENIYENQIYGFHNYSIYALYRLAPHTILHIASYLVNYTQQIGHSEFDLSLSDYNNLINAVYDKDIIDITFRYNDYIENQSFNVQINQFSFSTQSIQDIIRNITYLSSKYRLYKIYIRYPARKLK